MIKKILLLWMALMCMSFPWAQTSATESAFKKTLEIAKSGEELTLNDAFNIALENNAQVQNQRLLLEQARREAKNQWNNFLPSLNLGASYGNSPVAPQQILPTSSSGEFDWNASAGISLSFGSNLTTEMKIANLDYDIAITSYQKLLQTIETQVAGAYYGIIAATENLKALKEGLQLAKDEYDQVSNRFSVGAASELDVLRAQFSYESAGPQLRTGESNLRSLITDFLLLLGINTEILQDFSPEDFFPEDFSPEDFSPESFSLNGTIDPIQLNFSSMPNLVKTYTNNTIAVIQGMQALEKSQLTSTSTKLQLYAPSITVSENLTMSENNIGSGPIKINGSLSISLRLPLDNLIPGSKGNLTIQRVDDAIKSAEINLQNAQDTVRQSIRETHIDLDRLWDDISTATLNLTLAQRTYDLSQDAYENGLLDQTDLDTSRKNLTNADITLINTKIAYINGTYALANILNIRIDDLYDLYGVKS